MVHDEFIYNTNHMVYILVITFKDNLCSTITWICIISNIIVESTF